MKFTYKYIILCNAFCRTNENMNLVCFSAAIQHVRHVKTTKRQVYNGHGERSKPVLATRLSIVRLIIIIITITIIIHPPHREFIVLLKIFEQRVQQYTMGYCNRYYIMFFKRFDMLNPINCIANIIVAYLLQRVRLKVEVLLIYIYYRVSGLNGLFVELHNIILVCIY